jgi:UDP-3-O-[3-hydroxymyristoyl] glucosamine N-acyltransferase
VQQQLSYTLQEIAVLLGAELSGGSNCLVNGIMTLEKAQSGQISFLDNAHYLKYLPQTKASAVILRREYLDQCPCHALITTDPYLAFAKVAKLFEKKIDYSPGIHPTVILGKNTQIHPSAHIAPYCVLGDEVCIEENVIIDSGCYLGNAVHIGAQSRLFARVVLYPDTLIGQRTWIHSGSVLGSDGFGLAKDKSDWLKIPQLGRLKIGNDVEIGANVTIDRGALADTIIADGVKLDNQIQIGHNVSIGEKTAIAGCTGIAGSTRIGKNCLIGGGVCINGHIEICDNVMITGMSSVVHSITHPGVYSSTHSVQPRQEWIRNNSRFRQLHTLFRRFKKIESHLQQKS